MTHCQQYILADAQQAELYRRASQRRRATSGVRTQRVGSVQQRLGLLLVEAGLHLITRTDRGHLSPRTQRGF
jgi:hypothetical protein